MTNSVVEARNIFAGYGGGEVLRDFSLSVEAGCFAGLCGPNGAGKSTFLKLCLGMIRPRAGVIAVLGEKPGSAAFRQTLFRIGYVPQNTAGGGLPVTVREAAAMGRYGKAGFLRPLSRRDWELVDAALEAAGIRELSGCPVQELSGGQCQRTAIARSLAMEAELLLLDEPTASLDAGGRTELFSLIGRLREDRPLAVLMASHDAEALSECEIIYRFEEGKATRGEAHA
ncbi:MAG: metal ABC transporter ATP-binding protein [Treponema sp.]|jgi:ABC-type Mn2+/Zn2+ transport system ATPase subunit|nr:metal ABC transporter ATP-binding protein [Treponema sp.]